MAKQVARSREGGYEALVPLSTAPHRRPTQILVDLENEILTLRKPLDEEGLEAGPLTIQYHLRQRHGTAPGRSTIRRALGPAASSSLLSPRSGHGPPGSGSRRLWRIETWQADMIHWSIDDGTAEGTKVEILDFVDDHPRLVVAAVVVPVATAADVVAAFYKGASALRGLPPRS